MKFRINNQYLRRAVFVFGFLPLALIMYVMLATVAYVPYFIITGNSSYWLADDVLNYLFEPFEEGNY